MVWPLLTRVKWPVSLAKTVLGNADQVAQALIVAVKKKARAEQDNVTVLAIGFDRMKAAP